MSESTYSIIRFHFDKPNETLREGLTLEEAQEHCSDSETSSKTCSLETSLANPGQWFDGFSKE